MPNKSLRSSTPKFKTEAEEADWLSSPAGRQRTSREFEKAFRKGVIVNDDPSPEGVKTAREEARRTGKLVLNRKGINVKRTDPALLQKLYDDATTKITKQVSIRLPINHIAAAKARAKEKGVKYQTLLKEIIGAALDKAS